MALGHFQPKKPTVKGSAKFLIKRAVVAAAPGWIPALVIILPILLLFLVVISILGAAASSIPFANELGLGSTFHPTSIPTPTPNPNPDPGPDPDCGPEDSNINQRLKEDFGITIREGGIGWQGRTEGFNGKPTVGEKVDCPTRKAIYRSYVKPTRSPAYMRRLEPNFPFTFECYTVSGYSESKGLVAWTNRIQFVNCNNISESFNTYSYLVVHETGHLMARRNGRLFQDFDFERFKRNDSSCYNRNNGGVLKTYPVDPRDPKSESFAEAITLYVYNSKTSTYLLSQPIYNFKRECNDTYNWVRDNVYGGYEFN